MPPPPGGPRDWSPSDLDDASTRSAGIRPGARPIRGGGHADGLGWARFLGWSSLAVGLGGMIVAIVAPWDDRPFGASAVASVGGGAIWLGAMAAQRSRRAHRGSGVPAILGITVGAITVVLAFSAIVTIVMTGSSAPAPNADRDVAPAELPSGAVSDPNPSAGGAPEAGYPIPVDQAVEGSQLAQAALTADRALRASLGAGVAQWPAALAVSTDGTVLLGPDGAILTPLPPGTQVAYSTSSDRLAYSLTLFGGTFGSVATMDSVSGAVTVQ